MIERNTIRITAALAILVSTACQQVPQKHLPIDNRDDNDRPLAYTPRGVKAGDVLPDGSVVIDPDPRRTVVRNPDGSISVRHPSNY